MNLDGLNRLINHKGKAAGVEEWNIEDAKDLFLPLFNWSGRDFWNHAQSDELKWGEDRVLTNEIAEVSQRYMQVDWLKDEVIDWLLADAMAFGEVNATFKCVSPQRFYFHNGQPMFWMMGLAVLFRLLLWATWLFLMLLVYSKSEIVAGGVLLATVAYQYFKRKRLLRVATLLTSLADTYSALDACPPSWRNLYALMEKSRDKGAKWPTQLYRLIERNLSA